MAFIESLQQSRPRGPVPSRREPRGPAAYDQPGDVLADPWLDREAKRAILSSWASDANAVDSWPTLRRPPGARHPVALLDILDALRQLDADA